MNYFGATDQYVSVKDIHWPNGKKPQDFPHCGFDGSLCRGLTSNQSFLLDFDKFDDLKKNSK